MKKLTEKEVVRLLREEWNKKIESFLPEKDKLEKKDKKKADTDLSVEFPLKGEKEIVISPEFKVKSKKGTGQGLLYTVSNVNPTSKTITLTHQKEDGVAETTVTFDEFVKEFERQ
jgi:hypothetical protein